MCDKQWERGHGDGWKQESCTRGLPCWSKLEGLITKLVWKRWNSYIPGGAVWGRRLHGNVWTPDCWPGTVTTQQEGNSVADNTFLYKEFGSPHLHYFELVYISPIVSLHLSPSSTNHKITTKSTPIYTSAYKVHTCSRECIHMPHDSACMLITFHPCKLSSVNVVNKKEIHIIKKCDETIQSSQFSSKTK